MVEDEEGQYLLVSDVDKFTEIVLQKIDRIQCLMEASAISNKRQIESLRSQLQIERLKSRVLATQLGI
jgi:hypothetical protein